MVKVNSNQITFVDITDSRKLDIYISSNLPTTQIYNSNTGTYSPDWSTTNLQLTSNVYLDSKEITPEYIKWYSKVGTAKTLVGSNYTLTVSTNVLSSNPIITYVCEIEYQNIQAFKEITFIRTDTGLNGSNGVDGTGVTILGSYNTIEELQTAHPIGNAGDAYIVNGDLYVWAVDDTQWENVGNIQGPAGIDGKNAKSIVLSGDSQVFKVSKTNVITPSTIKVTAQAFNTTITNWTYSINGGQSFLSTVPTGVSRNGNIVTVTGSTLASNSIVIKASDGEVEDVFTIYKAIDGVDGSVGAPAPIAFLTNENVTFSANAQGQISGTTITSNVVSYNGTTKVTPTIGTITGIPTGMTITPSTIAASNEIMLTITIVNNATLGSASSNMGVISVPIISPVSTVLSLTWSKVNSGAIGVGIKSTTVSYGVSDFASTRPTDTEWQSTIPVVADGKYLWTRTIIDYTDDAIADTVTYTYAKQGQKGDTGSTGSSVTVSSVQYQEGASATIPPTSTWSDSVISVAEGKFLWTKTAFSDGKIAYGVAKQGQKGSNGTNGTNASLVDITPSAYYFKSTTGKDGTFTPEYIYVYPRFQTVTFSKWEYSTNGGATWTAASGANGLTISTYNSVANTLRIARTSTLYTDTVTSISFRCVSSNAAVYDTVSIAKIYDVVDLEIGGRNMYLDTKNYGGESPDKTIWNFSSTSALDGTYLGLNVVKITSPWGKRWQIIPLTKLAVGGVYTMSAWIKNPGGDDDDYKTRIGYFYDTSANAGATYTILSSNFAQYMYAPTEWTRISVTFRIDTITDNTQYCRFRFEPYTDDNTNHLPNLCICGLKFEAGNKATDWSPAPEDIDANIAKVDTRITGVESSVKTTTDNISSRVSTTEQSITTINGSLSSLSTKVSAAEQKITSDAIVSTVRQSTDYINDLGSKVGTTEIISKINQTAETVTISANKIGLLGATNIPDLTADKIKGGTLTLGGSSSTTQNGQLLVKNASNVNMLKVNKDGIVVKSNHLAVAEDFANSTYNWSTNTWTTTTNTSQLDLGDDYIRMGVYSPSGYSNYMRLLDNGLHFQGNAQGIGSWGSFIGHDDYGDFVIQDTVRGYIVFKGPDDDTAIANISGSGLSVSGVYSNTIASSANVHIDSYGQFYKSTSSSQRYKTDIQDIQSEELNPERLYNLPVREFKFKEGYLSDKDSCVNTFVPGFIAEEVAEVYPIACEYDDDKPENWNIRFIVPAMLKLIQEQNKRIKALEEQINNKAVN